jgi:hypothetical protein
MLDAWTADLPIGRAWGCLPAGQIAAELAICDRGLLQTDVARRRFRERLSLRFPAVTAICDIAVAGQGGSG